MVAGFDGSVEEDVTQEELSAELARLKENAKIGKRPLPSFMDKAVEPWLAEGEFTATDVKNKYKMGWQAADARIRKWCEQKEVKFVGKRRAVDESGRVKIVKAYVEIVP